MFLEIFLYALLVLVVKQLITWLYNRWQLLATFTRAGIAGPKPSFVTGNIGLFDRQYLFEIMPTWLEQYGPVFGYYRGSQPMLVIKNLPLINEVFVKQFKQFPNRLKFMVDAYPFSSSVLALRDDAWRKVRRVLTPAFNAAKIKSLANESIDETMDCLIRILQTELTDGQSYNVKYVQKVKGEGLMVNMSQLSKRYTMSVICRYAFGIEKDDILSDEHCPLFHMTEQFFDTAVDNVLVRISMLAPFIKPVIRFINDYITSGPVIDHLVKYLDKVIHEQSCELGPRSKNNLLQFMITQLETGQLSHDEVIGNLVVILLAGYETTANAISFVMFNLAKHPAIQQQLREQITDGDGEQLLDAILYESMRLYPPVIDYVIRECSDKSGKADVTLQDGPHYIHLAHNVAIQVPVWQLHHDPQIWPDPYTFNPDRDGLFSESGSSLSRNDCRFVAFGIGQRSCIGGTLAMAEMRAICRWMVKTFQIDLPPNDVYQYNYDCNGLIQVEARGELIRPCQDVCLIFTKHSPIDI